MGEDNQPKPQELKTPRKPEDIIKQLEAKGKEERAKAFERGAGEIIKARDEAARTVRLKQSELEEYIAKFKADLL